MVIFYACSVWGIYWDTSKSARTFSVYSRYSLLYITNYYILLIGAFAIILSSLTVINILPLVYIIELECLEEVHLRLKKEQYMSE